VRSTLDELTKELSELRALVGSIAPVNSALAEHHDSLVREYLTIRRRFDYAAFVVALYASFEKFSESLVASYARLAAFRSKYAELPASLTRKHMAKSADLLARGRLGEGRYVGTREIDVVKNLLDCLSGTSPYSLNEHAVVAHDYNLRSEELSKLFASVGIDHVCDRSRHADALVDWFRMASGIDQTVLDDVPATTVKQRLDDLVERRNQVTHGGESPLELLGTTEMTNLVDFVEALATSVFSLTVGSYLQGRYVSSTEACALKLLSGPFKQHTVVVVEKPAKRLYVGQPVFTFVESTGARWGRIRELQINDVSTPAVEQDSNVADVGIAVDFRCPKGVVLSVLDVDDDVVWSPSDAIPETAAAEAT
jgi:hypothetical protein